MASVRGSHTRLLRHFVLVLLFALLASKASATSLVAGADHTGENHSGENHSGEDLTGITLSNGDLSNANLKDTIFATAMPLNHAVPYRAYGQRHR